MSSPCIAEYRGKIYEVHSQVVAIPATAGWMGEEVRLHARELRPDEVEKLDVSQVIREDFWSCKNQRN